MRLIVILYLIAYNNVNIKDIERYYNDYIEDFQQKKSKDIDFVIFSVSPSSEDDLNTKSSLESLKKEFQEYEDYMLFTKRNSDNTSSKFIFTTQQEFEDPYWDELLNKDMNHRNISPFSTNPT